MSKYIGAKSFKMGEHHFRLVVSKGYYTCGCGHRIKDMESYWTSFITGALMCYKCGEPYWKDSRTDDCGYPVEKEERKVNDIK